jgi:monoamine oxidase
MSLKDRIVAARRGAIKLHDEFKSEAIVPSEKAISIAWQNSPFQGEGTAHWDPQNPAHQRAYRRLLAPDGKFFMIGDQISPYPGWQEGAIISAEHVMAQITGRRSTEISILESAPDSRRMLMGLV